MIYPIAVQSNKFKPFKSVSCRLGKPNWFAPRYSFKRLFYCLFGNVPLTLLSAHVCGSEGGKRIALTKGYGRTRVLPQVING